MTKKRPKKKRNRPLLSSEQNEILREIRRYTKLRYTERLSSTTTRLTGKHREKAYKLLTETVPALNEQYYKTGIDLKIFGEPKNVVTAGNIIQLPENYANMFPDELIDTWSPNEYFLHSIPCFKEGTVEIHSDEETIYTHWTVNEIDMDRRAVDITIQLYAETELHGKLTWSPSIRLRYELAFSDENSVSVRIAQSESICLSDISTIIPYSKLNWSPFEVELWKNSSALAAKIQEETWCNDHETDFNMTTIYEFLIQTATTNLLLEQNRPVIRRETTPNVNKKPATQFEYDPEKQSRRRTRTVGPICIKSEVVPHAPTTKSVVKYTLESWNRRGHIRHYKSGKTVYIQPTVHHRHALKNKTSQPAPTTIKVTGT